MHTQRQLFCLVCLLIVSPLSHAVTVWSTSFSATGTESDQLITYDSATPGTVNVIGSTGVAENFAFYGLDFDATGKLYGYTADRSTGSLEPGGLYEIDTATGAATFIGTGGVDAGGWLVDISYNPADGLMYGLQLRGSAQNRATILYTIDLTTGAATKIGDVSPFGFFPGGLATDASGGQSIFDAGDSHVWDLVGLNATQLPLSTGFNSLTGNGLTVDWSRDGAMYLNGHENFFPGGVLPEAQFWTIDPTTGMGTKLGTIGDGQTYRVVTLAIAPGQPVGRAPAPATLGLIAIGLAAMRRRR
ncbi:MAG: hypothetical protein KDJ39_07625 [Gammaproteobacteria bacterium]|nr:hypothetical protein [Gammaproteobacteria bacterium]MCP5298505.1 hypothetical protein [Chromatiaceae bacterium]